MRTSIQYGRLGRLISKVISTYLKPVGAIMSKRKRRSHHNADSLAEWRELMEHRHVPGYWASVSRLPPGTSVRSAFGCTITLLGGMLLLAGIVGVLARRPEILTGAFGTLALGGVLLLIGSRMLRRRRQ